MTNQDFNKIAIQYKKKDREYSDLLLYIQMNCQEDFFPLFEKAESEGKKLFLINGYPELEHSDVLIEINVLLEDIAIH